MQQEDGSPGVFLLLTFIENSFTVDYNFHRT
jgi:hypothetical protein